jgi:hypothetical protein
MSRILIVMSISHPRLRSFTKKTSPKGPAGLAAWVGMVHYVCPELRASRMLE